MTLRDRMARAIAEREMNEWVGVKWEARPKERTSFGMGKHDALRMADAALSALPCTLSQLEMIERGELVLTPKDDGDIARWRGE